MISIAVIGPDGAGKTTVSRQLAQLLPVPVRYVYMGVNLEASNVMLPTSRLLLLLKRRRGASGASSSERGTSRPATQRRKSLLGRLKSNLRLLNRIAEEWYRQLVAWRLRRGGAVVLFDRHFIADYIVDRQQHNEAPVLMARLRRLLLERVYPQPDLVIYLDAPAELLFARKGEGTIADLERRRGEYLSLSQRSRNFVVIDARQSEDAVARQVADVVAAHYHARTGRSIAVAPGA